MTVCLENVDDHETHSAILESFPSTDADSNLRHGHVFLSLGWSCGNECQCHSLGSLESKCDMNGNCRCRAGVGGVKCDHCLPGFWGLHLIALGQQSCQPCGCSAFGSARADCEQSTGRCECSHGARGKRCDRCTTDFIMTASGCVPKEEYRTPDSCSSLGCHHGAKCVESVSGLPDCECPEHCDMNHLGIGSSYFFVVQKAE
ncbi:Kazal-type serine protease inhibitor domain [Parelaphostrongylus tenuis]|uniref:Kazal-type serine protease inhibitor domain n=1 Tax=Parelaphostrongylus tenuis TaxID=148309 RepID=A0AAD5MP40_PARTN|nr:Kazal-type serine protease inhibitor domain [Parelaphostrongylus tenuis]